MTSPSLDDRISQLLTHEWRGEKRISGLQGSAKAYAVFLAARRLDCPLLVLAPSVKEAEGLFLDLSFFLGEEAGAPPLERRLHLFPGWDILPFESLSPHPTRWRRAWRASTGSRNSPRRCWSPLRRR